MSITVMLDAGHFGDRNQSPVVPAYFESRRMWALRGFLVPELEKYGITVKQTRSNEETDVPVTERGRMAKGCDLFISLHSNAVGTGGSEKTDHVCVYCAYDDLNNASVLAERLSVSIAELMKVNAGYVKTRKSTEGEREYYGVLRGAREVGCPLFYIIEHSFHTNEYAAKWLLDDANLQKLAQLEAAVIAAHFGLGASSLPGDVNGDGKLDASDYILIKRAVLGTVTLSEAQKKLADVDGDGDVDSVDYTMAKRAVLGTFTLPEKKTE